MGNLLVSTTGAAGQLGAAQTGQAIHVGAGLLGRDGYGTGYAMSGTPAWAWWDFAADGTVELTIATQPGAGQQVGVMARATATSYYLLLAREWGDVILIRQDSSRAAPNSWAEGDSFQRQSNGKVFIPGDRIGIKTAGGQIQVLVNGVPIPLMVNMAQVGTTITDPTPLTGTGAGVFVTNPVSGAGMFGSLVGTDPAGGGVQPVAHTRSIADYIGFSDRAAAGGTAEQAADNLLNNQASGFPQLIRWGDKWLTTKGRT